MMKDDVLLLAALPVGYNAGLGPILPPCNIERKIQNKSLVNELNACLIYQNFPWDCVVDIVHSVPS